MVLAIRACPVSESEGASMMRERHGDSRLNFDQTTMVNMHMVAHVKTKFTPTTVRSSSFIVWLNTAAEVSSSGRSGDDRAMH